MRSTTLLSGLAALLALTGPGMALAGQISVIPPPVIVTPVPVPPPVVPTAPAPGAVTPSVQPTVSNVAGSTGGSGVASVPAATLQSFNVTTLSPGQMQVAAATIRGLLAAPGPMSDAQIAVLQSQLAQMDAMLGQ